MERLNALKVFFAFLDFKGPFFVALPTPGYLSWASFHQPPQGGVGGQAWVEKFVLNLCFKVPEFVLLFILRD